MKTRTKIKPLANMKGKFCPFLSIRFCQEGECGGCQIYLDVKANELKGGNIEMGAIRIRTLREVRDIVREHFRSEEFKTGLLCGITFACFCFAIAAAFV